jgi:acrylyl-CoA reductase (NADPH)
MPFILRGVTLAGIDSVMRPLADRETAWERIADVMDSSVFEEISHEISLEDTISTAKQLLEGQVRGRVVVSLS